MNTRNRVCIRTRGGIYKTAGYARYAEEGDEWIPVPPGRLDLAEADRGRPAGVHPQIWYGWPRGPVETGDAWRVENEAGVSVDVHAFSLAAALEKSGFRTSEIVCVSQRPRWY